MACTLFLCIPKFTAWVNSRHHFLPLFYCLRTLYIHVICSGQIYSPFSPSPINPPQSPLPLFSLNFMYSFLKTLSPCSTAMYEREYRAIFCILCRSCTWSHSHGVQIIMFSCRYMLPLVLKTSLHFFCAHPWALGAGVVVEMSHLGLSTVKSYPPHFNLLWVSALITISWGAEELLWWESHHQVLEGDQEDVLIYEYKDKFLEGRLIVWPFSRLIVIDFPPSTYGLPSYEFLTS